MLAFDEPKQVPTPRAEVIFDSTVVGAETQAYTIQQIEVRHVFFLVPGVENTQGNQDVDHQQL